MTKRSPAPKSARISIIGGGPGGLTCARVLQRQGIEATVYEAEAGPHVRNQGGSIDLHADNGQIALREAGLLEQFLKLARPEGQQMRWYGTNGNILADEIPEGEDLFKPEIDRGQLRDLLIESLAPETIQWGRRLESVEGPDDGPRVLRFRDGSSVETDLVVGADGAFSRVRAAISSAVPKYSGFNFVEAWFNDVERNHHDLSAMVGQGSASAADGTRSLFAQRNSGNHIRVYIIRKVAQDWAARAGLAMDDSDGIHSLLRKEFAAWAPTFELMYGGNDGEYIDRPLFVLPVPHEWQTSSTVTLLGDAAHLMLPLGVGVNYAMLDGADLAVSLSTASTVAEGIAGYEAIMVPRATKLMTLLENGGQFFLAPYDPDSPKRGEDPTGVEDPERAK